MELGRAQASAQGEVVVKTLAGLAADDSGEPDARPPLVLLHGLTFDRTLWRLTSCGALTPAGGFLRWIFPVTAHRGHGRGMTLQASPTACTAPSRRRSCDRPWSSGTP